MHKKEKNHIRDYSSNIISYVLLPHNTFWSFSMTHDVTEIFQVCLASVKYFNCYPKMHRKHNETQIGKRVFFGYII